VGNKFAIHGVLGDPGTELTTMTNQNGASTRSLCMTPRKALDQRYEFDQITPEQFDRTIAVNFRHV
jgi:hypothetical protein